MAAATCFHRWPAGGATLTGWYETANVSPASLVTLVTVGQSMAQPSSPLVLSLHQMGRVALSRSQLQQHQSRPPVCIHACHSPPAPYVAHSINGTVVLAADADLNVSPAVGHDGWLGHDDVLRFRVAALRHQILPACSNTQQPVCQLRPATAPPMPLQPLVHMAGSTLTRNSTGLPRPPLQA